MLRVKSHEKKERLDGKCFREPETWEREDDLGECQAWKSQETRFRTGVEVSCEKEQKQDFGPTLASILATGHLRCSGQFRDEKVELNWFSKFKIYSELRVSKAAWEDKSAISKQRRWPVARMETNVGPKSCFFSFSQLTSTRFRNLVSWLLAGASPPKDDWLWC